MSGWWGCVGDETGSEPDNDRVDTGLHEGDPAGGRQRKVEKSVMDSEGGGEDGRLP